MPLASLCLLETHSNVNQYRHMSRVRSALRTSPLVFATLGVIAVAEALAVVWPLATSWLLGVFAVAMALHSAAAMVGELRSGTFGVDILAVTAIGATVAVGELWAAAVIVLMLTGGEALERYAAGRARADLTALASNAPRRAHLVGRDGAVCDVDVEAVAVGQRVLVRAHEVVPLDGVLVSDAGVFDDSSLTGEPLPQERVAGDTVYSGAVNGASAVTLEVARVAAESQYQRIVALVEEAAASRAPMVRLADRYAIPFTAVSLAIAGAAWWASGDPLRFAQVLVVATPCPLIIGAPVAFMAGMSRAARRGVIIRSSATLERLRRVGTVAFDKTGTLTRGTPTLTDVRAAPGVEPDTVLSLAAGAEQASTHVLAEAIVRGARARGLSLPAPREVVETTAGGVTASVGGTRVVVGKRAFVAAGVGEVAEPRLAAGELAVHVSADGAYAGCVVLRDEPRPDAEATVARLRAQGVGHVMILTGDEEATARYVAEQVGVADVRSGCLPADKVAAVRAVTRRPVVMVGDGVNDAPVLAAADVGVALAARGSTAATESADVVVLPDEIGRVAEAVEIGRHTVAVALQSVWIGITVSVALMFVATTGALPAVVGAWLQEAVDVVAIAWALRAMGAGALRRREAPAPAGAPEERVRGRTAQRAVA
ncbi:heavy metal-(Cd/Co/Hg/Pb/Zn)-translocating P-type ATPase [Xylanimonas ulmi]|uniref:Heavy metal-(Cd/Co/Hg/Pb/Zn)-translocating P-type ATPase n=2 Tax=Xylanimonas ulmi TaxID=228973 RepID=A0A4Q7LZW4_9MICO|nr:heavy metal-(Cd/Co/Hg/Pb/Zn)-translocating P-type ATPase [Xylanibacterium ulmi]